MKGYHRRDWLYSMRMPRFEIGIIEEDPDPRKFVPIREQICMDCFKEYQKDYRRTNTRYDFGGEGEIFDTKNL